MNKLHIVSNIWSTSWPILFDLRSEIWQLLYNQFITKFELFLLWKTLNYNVIKTYNLIVDNVKMLVSTTSRIVEKQRIGRYE